jgi:FixJ family two-component response regulator
MKSAIAVTAQSVLKLIAEDKISKDVTAKLFVSSLTVEIHRSNICKNSIFTASLLLLTNQICQEKLK